VALIKIAVEMKAKQVLVLWHLHLYYY